MKTITYKVIRSNTGKYHLGLNNAANCNGRSGKFQIVAIKNISSAADSSFCSKCFGINGAKQYAVECAQKAGQI